MSQTEALPLDSPRWRSLQTRRGEGAEWVSDALRALQGGPDADVFHELWPELCSEESTYDAAFAAAPYLAQIATGEARSGNTEYLVVLGLIATYAAEEVPADLAPGYQWATQTALTLTLGALVECSPDHDLRYLLSAVAAFRGRADLASANAEYRRDPGVVPGLWSNRVPLRTAAHCRGRPSRQSRLRRLTGHQLSGKASERTHPGYARYRSTLPMVGCRSDAK